MGSSTRRIPSLWQGLRWAWRPEAAGGGTSRPRMAWRSLRATFGRATAMKRWMQVACELQSRGVAGDLPALYLRAIRPYVHGGVDFNERVVQLIDHMDWLETAFQPAAFDRLTSGKAVTLVELAPPRGFDYLRLQLQMAPPQSPEGEMLLTLNLQRSADVQNKAQPMEAAALAFSRFRVAGRPSLVIGGVRGQRDPVQRMSPMELNQALQGWKPPVLLVRAAQELARYWKLHLVGLNPAAHRLHHWSYTWNKRYRASGQRVFASYDALWEHFGCKPGEDGWMVVPLNSDEKLAATALSPEKRARQERRADYWIRTRNVMRLELKRLLRRPDPEAHLSGFTEQMDRESMAARLNYLDPQDDDDPEFASSDDVVPSRVLQTGPGDL